MYYLILHCREELSTFGYQEMDASEFLRKRAEERGWLCLLWKHYEPYPKQVVRGTRHDQVYKKLCQNGHSPEYVWSGMPINDLALLHVDHRIPFAAGKNNNLWNLLPARESVNAKKRDKIPSPAFIDRRSDAIVNYWDHMYEVYPRRFSREINPALTGSPEKMPGWQDAALERLEEKCEYLIEMRGFDAWSR